MAGAYVINDREPKKLYRYFEDLAKIPRVTFHEEAASQYVADFAEERGLWYCRDRMYNVLIQKEGSKGCEHLPPVLLEGHLDMVGAKEEWSSHNFETDPIELIEEGNILRANGTTLGADNGCAIAIMLALLDDEELIHPPMECLFTTQEETGLDGMKGFDVSLIRSRRAIGLDAGSEGVFRMGTTTKIQITAGLAVKREKAKGRVYELLVDGLRGGTQGEAMPKGRLCAIKIMFRLLHYLRKKMEIHIADVSRMGSGIPESCRAVLVLDEERTAEAEEILMDQQRRIRSEYEDSDPDVRIRLNEIEDYEGFVLDRASAERLIDSLYLLPWGARNRSISRRNEVTCSGAVKRIYTEGDVIRIYYVISSEEREQGEAMEEEVKACLMLHQWEIEKRELERGWDKERSSPIRSILVQSYIELFGKEPIVNVSHGANDCVVLKHKIPEMDVVTTAATYDNCHTPRECLNMDSFEKVFYLLQRALLNMTKIC